MRKSVAIGFAALAAMGMTAATAQQAQGSAVPTFGADGTVHVPAFDLPPSSLTSPEAQGFQARRASRPDIDPMPPEATIEQRRAAIEARIAPAVAGARLRYAVDVVEQRIGGVRTRIVTPREGEADRGRVLINLHGGAFMMCAENCALIESIPIAAVGRYRVVTVDYRQGPENRFPAASEDVASVYQELLKSYRPENIGIYGCSAGGALTAEAVAWFADKKIPMPGAVGIFGAGGIPFGVGDSATVSGYIDGSFPPPKPGNADMPPPYFRGVKMDDPLVSPAYHPDVAAKFPPTLIITGSRAMDMSPAIYTHGRLLKAGVRSNLIVAEGMGHCYMYRSSVPEARDAYDQIVKFFDENLGHGGKGGSAATAASTAPRREERRRAEDCMERTNVRTKTPGADGKFWFPAKKKGC